MNVKLNLFFIVIVELLLVNYTKCGCSPNFNANLFLLSCNSSENYTFNEYTCQCEKNPIKTNTDTFIFKGKEYLRPNLEAYDIISLVGLEKEILHNALPACHLGLSVEACQAIANICVRNYYSRSDSNKHVACRYITDQFESKFNITNQLRPNDTNAEEYPQFGWLTFYKLMNPNTKAGEMQNYIKQDTYVEATLGRDNNIQNNILPIYIAKYI